MKYAYHCNREMTRSSNFIEAASIIAKCGYDGVELCCEPMGKDIIDALKEKNLSVSSIFVETDLLMEQGDGKQYFSELNNHLEKAIDLADQMDAECIVVNPAPDTKKIEDVCSSIEEFIQESGVILKEKVKSAQKKGIKVAVTADEDSVFKGPRLGAFAEEINADLACDLAALCADGDPYLAILKVHKDMLSFVRLDDMRKEENVVEYCEIGKGVVEIASAVQELESDPVYDGWVVLGARLSELKPDEINMVR